ncbi:purine and uridine phosphorylase [Aspergillus granulosus]|uniref:Purine and uridine phosphorylase n=1 Tax=Aspergillus granulosus TaxID=176169 RepID=A0ABR4GSQ8_9EURO
MSAEGRKKLKANDYTVGIICCLGIERTAMKFMLDEEHDRPPKLPGDKSVYIGGSIHGHNVVIASLPLGYTGTTPVGNVAHDMEHSFPSLKLRLLVGIGGGVPSDKVDIRLGDVVVSAPKDTYGGVVQYDYGRQKEGGFELKGCLCPPPSEWLHVLTDIMSTQGVRQAHCQNRITENISILTKIGGLEHYNRPKVVDVLFEASSHHVKEAKTCDGCDKRCIVPRSTRTNPDSPVVHCGLIASGNRVMEHGLERDRISKELGGVICFEMEAAGLMNEFRCIVIRGICDYADSHKQDIWQPYAAAVAAGFAKELLSYIEVPACMLTPPAYQA